MGCAVSKPPQTTCSFLAAFLITEKPQNISKASFCECLLGLLFPEKVNLWWRYTVQTTLGQFFLMLQILPLFLWNVLFPMKRPFPWTSYVQLFPFMQVLNMWRRKWGCICRSSPTGHIHGSPHVLESQVVPCILWYREDWLTRGERRGRIIFTWTSLVSSFRWTGNSGKSHHLLPEVEESTYRWFSLSLLTPCQCNISSSWEAVKPSMYFIIHRWVF